MKRMDYCLCLLLSLLLLTGCRKQEFYTATQPPETTVVHTEATTIPTIQPTEALTEPPTELPTQPLPEPADEEFVKISDYIPGIHQELFYATDKNFTGQVIYDFEDAYLRYGTVKKLMAASADLAEMGLYLKIWDGFRPVSAQFRLWEVCPDPTYVANPTTGYSSHSRGNTVDLTLVDADGAELEMPTGFDDFSAKADRNYSDCTEAAANNAQILQVIMEKYGFTGYFGEWWHYSDTVSYPVEEIFEP